MDSPAAIEVIKATKKFGIDDAEFVGFYHEKPIAIPTSKDVRVSAYPRGQELLLVIMNPSEKDLTGEKIELNREYAGIAAKYRLRGCDHGTGSMIALIMDDVLSLDMPAKSLRLIRVSAAE